MLSEDNHEAHKSGFSGADLDFEFQQGRNLDGLMRTQDSRRPLEVMSEGHDRMTQWGLSLDQVGQLEQMTSNYEYANLTSRAERVAINGGIVMHDDEAEYVVLPDFFDYAGDRRDGQCNEIAAKLLAELHESGWLRKTNTDLEAQGLTPLVPWHCMGMSLTHFNWPGLRHSWTALAPAGQDPAETGIILDASFRKIDAFEASGYTATDKKQDPSFYIAPKAARCSVTRPDSGVLPRMESTVLGVTQDGFYSVGLSFVRPPDDDRIVTVLGATAPNGTPVACHLSSRDEIIWHDGHAPLAPVHREELEQILRSLSSIKFNHDEDEARRLLAERQRLDILR
jgi:hypothetical protein